MDALRESYKIWHNYSIHFPKFTKYTLGIKVDNLFTDCLNYALRARYADNDSKYCYIDKLIITFDSLKFFLQILWELKALDNKKYAKLSKNFSKIGKMIGGWGKYTKNKTPANNTGAK